MESTILYNCFAQLADAGCHIEKNIEDGDGGSDKSFTLVYSGTESASLLCGNHASRWAGRMYGAVVKAHACVAVDESRSWLAARCVSFYQDVYLSVCLSALKRVAAVGATNS